MVVLLEEARRVIWYMALIYELAKPAVQALGVVGLRGRCCPAWDYQVITDMHPAISLASLDGVCCPMAVAVSRRHPTDCSRNVLGPLQSLPATPVVIPDYEAG